MRRFEDVGTGLLQEAPGLGYDWNANARIRHPIRGVVARERDVVIAYRNPLEVISFTSSGLALTSSASHPFTHLSIAGGNTAWAFLDLGETQWAFGPQSSSEGSERIFCPFTFTPEAGIAAAGACSDAPGDLMGTAYGGMWTSSLRGPTHEPRTGHFYRPGARGSVAVVDSLELPKLRWFEGEVPLATWPDASTLLVPRVDADKLTLDRYQGTDGHEWAGATMEWIWENPASGGTRVYRR
ncbi:MAG: hypothetical protein Q8L48_12145 [Archangium sp.]|nr:hypothetical protein [Archangium sp.]